MANTMTKEKLKEFIDMYLEIEFKYKKKWYSITYYYDNRKDYISFCEFYKEPTEVSSFEELLEIKRNGVTVWEMISSIDDTDMVF